MSSTKSLKTRFVHALGFELIALLICAPVLSLVLNISAAHAGALTLMISLLAMAWNMAFNAMFDRIIHRLRMARTFAVRLANALTFEMGLVLMAVPLAAWWLEVSLIDALVLDLGLILFFLPYTLVYNWAYDRLTDHPSR